MCAHLSLLADNDICSFRHDIIAGVVSSTLTLVIKSCLRINDS